MMATTHRLGGLVAGVIVMDCYTPLPLKIIAIGASVLGSLASDIDNKNSTISHKFKIISVIVTLGQGLIRLLSNLLPRKLKAHVRGAIGHRGITHSIVGCVIVYILLTMLSVTIGNQLGIARELRVFTIAFLAGMASHIILDMFAGGTPLFCPITNKRIKILSIKTGGAVELVVRVLLGVILLCMTYQKFI